MKFKIRSGNRKAQEEMVGFALIIIIVSIILLAFLGFFLSKPGSSVQSYKAQSFVQSVLQTSTQCQDSYGYVSVEDLISMCTSGTQCLGGSDPCPILNSTLEGILAQSWPVGSGSPYNGYNMNITSINGYNLAIQQGNTSSNSEGAYFPIGGNSTIITFNVYS